MFCQGGSSDTIKVKLSRGDIARVAQMYVKGPDAANPAMDRGDWGEAEGSLGQGGPPAKI